MGDLVRHARQLLPSIGEVEPEAAAKLLLAREAVIAGREAGSSQLILPKNGSPTGQRQLQLGETTPAITLVARRPR
jgi:hypothetical protein